MFLNELKDLFPFNPRPHYEDIQSEVYQGPARHREPHQARRAGIQSGLHRYKNILCSIIPPCQGHSGKNCGTRRIGNVVD